MRTGDVTLQQGGVLYRSFPDDWQLCMPKTIGPSLSVSVSVSISVDGGARDEASHEA